jgi:hypothetical protein
MCIDLISNDAGNTYIKTSLKAIGWRPPSRKLKSRYGARNRFQEPSLELSSQATQAGGPVRQPYAYLVLALIAGVKFPPDTGY